MGFYLHVLTKKQNSEGVLMEGPELLFYIL